MRCSLPRSTSRRPLSAPCDCARSLLFLCPTPARCDHAIAIRELASAAHPLRTGAARRTGTSRRRARIFSSPSAAPTWPPTCALRRSGTPGRGPSSPTGQGLRGSADAPSVSPSSARLSGCCGSPPAQAGLRTLLRKDYTSAPWSENATRASGRQPEPHLQLSLPRHDWAVPLLDPPCSQQYSAAARRLRAASDPVRDRVPVAVWSTTTSAGRHVGLWAAVRRNRVRRGGEAVVHRTCPTPMTIPGLVLQGPPSTRRWDQSMSHRAGSR